MPLPNADPDTWTNANCAVAFEAIAEAWDETLFSIIAPGIVGVLLTRREFIQWIDKCRYQPPTFWGVPSEDDDEQQPTDNTVPRITIAITQPKRPKSSAAWQGIRKLWPQGPPEKLATADIHRKVNEWLKKQQRSLYPFTEVSRETIARLLHRK